MTDVTLPSISVDTSPGNSLGPGGTQAEIATVVVNGQKFTDWTAVRVEERCTEPFPTFMLEVTEESPTPVSWGKSLLAPGAPCQIYLGNHLAITGVITERHVAFDAKMHGVRLIGAGRTFDVSTSSVPLDKLGNHDGKSVVQLAKDLTAHLGVNVKTVGEVDATPFEKAQVQPGEFIISTIERYARMRAVVVGSDKDGNLLLIGKHASEPDATHLVEGGNILRANAAVRDGNMMKYIVATGQDTGSDGKWGDPVNKQIAFRQGSSTRERHTVIPTELADIPLGVQRRADMEFIFTDGSEIEAHITVQGWFKRDGSPWRAREYYVVESPSLILQRMLGCKAVVYEQSAAGTMTTLEMVKPEHLNGLVGAQLRTSAD